MKDFVKDFVKDFLKYVVKDFINHFVKNLCCCICNSGIKDSHSKVFFIQFENVLFEISQSGIKEPDYIKLIHTCHPHAPQFDTGPPAPEEACSGSLLLAQPGSALAGPGLGS